VSGTGDDPLKFDDLDLPGEPEQEPQLPGDSPEAEFPTADTDQQAPAAFEPEGEQAGATAEPTATAPSATEPEEEPPAKKAKKRAKPGLLARLRQTSPYVVLLGITVLALLLGIGVLFCELWRYQFEFRPQI